MPLAPILLSIPLFPLCGAMINGILGKKFRRQSVNVIALVSVLLSFGAAVSACIVLFGTGPQVLGNRYIVNYFPWIQSGNFLANFGFQLDPLTGVMLLVVTGVGLVIHLYATGYMAQEGGYYRFFAFLNLFMFSMLILVLANNFLLMFVGWEGVGLCSYLLIGFYFRRDSAANAGKKAFIVNRIGDFGFLLAIFLVFWNYGSLDFSQVFSQVRLSPMTQTGGNGIITAICLLLFLGATGKSAQIPLYIWLPDAMEGPTPVSALIHAATMVTAGIYMVARCNVLYSMSPFALSIVAAVGVLTALMAASIGLLQTDIKKILAYSTVSQLGFMFLACGVGAFSSGIFHLVTHAFFKALLFLGAGSVIHALSGEQDIREMGGLRHPLPVTTWTMIFGTLAITGFFPFAGFFSKDEILWQTLKGGHWVLWSGGMIASAMTSFYMFRLIFLTFFGRSRLSHDAAHHLHESPPSMTLPLQILALGSLFVGWLGAPHIFHLPNYFESFLEPVFRQTEELEPSPAGASLEWLAMSLSLAMAFLGAYIAYLFYLRNTDLPERLSRRWSSLYQIVFNKYWVDEYYQSLFVNPLLITSREFLWRIFDVRLIDGGVNGIAHFFGTTGGMVRQLHSGYVRSYAGWILLGTVAILFYCIFVIH
jgi:NADH-quinone oxidoreductase subunit L